MSFIFNMPYNMKMVPKFLRNTIFTNEIGKDLLSLSQVLPSLTNGLAWDSPLEEISNVLRTLALDN